MPLCTIKSNLSNKQEVKKGIQSYEAKRVIFNIQVWLTQMSQVSMGLRLVSPVLELPQLSERKIAQISHTLVCDGLDNKNLDIWASVQDTRYP